MMRQTSPRLPKFQPNGVFATYGQGRWTRTLLTLRYSPPLLCISQRRLAECKLGSFMDLYKSRKLSHSSQVDASESSVDLEGTSDYSESWDPETMPLRPSIITGDKLPPLPEIRNVAIRKQVLTHRSVHARPTNVFEDSLGDPAPDNERLEHLGDAVLQLVVTGLLQETYPRLRVGPATKIRSLIVGNGTLAEISVKYKLPQILILHHAQAMTLRTSVHIRADVFEAYVGGLFVDQGLEAVKEWLFALLRPYVYEAYRIVREQHGLPPVSDAPSFDALAPYNSTTYANDWVPPSPAPTPAPTNNGYLSLFNQNLQQKRQSVEWVYKSERGPGTKSTPIWVVQALLDGECVAIGRGSTKKAAQNDAAKEGLIKLGVIDAEGDVSLPALDYSPHA